MNKIKIAFFDIDGTMIDMEKKVISPKMVEALNKLKENGIYICVATGRSPLTLPVFDDVQFDTFLTYNGSYCYTPKQTIFSNPLLREDVKKIIKNADAIGRPVSIATKDRLAANGIDQDLVDYFNIANISVNVSEDFDKIANEEVYQIMVGGTEEEYAAITDQTKQAKATAWWERAADIIPAAGGKGIGIEKILEYYHLEKENAIAFGDGNNDIEMLQTVGWGVAMENASDQLKKVADDICGHVAEDGIYYYCLEHGLI